MTILLVSSGEDVTAGGVVLAVDVDVAGVAVVGGGDVVTVVAVKEDVD